MAEKQTKTGTRKPARTLEQQIADRQAKQEAINEKQALWISTRYTVFTDQLVKAEERVAAIKENIAALTKMAEDLGIVLEENIETEAETETETKTETESVKVQKVEVV